MNTSLIEKQFKEAMIENHDLKKSEKLWNAMFGTIEGQLFTSYDIVRGFMKAKGVTDEFKSYVKSMIESEKLDASYRDFFEAMLDDFCHEEKESQDGEKSLEENLRLLEKKKMRLLEELSLASNEDQINSIGKEAIAITKEIRKRKNELENFFQHLSN
ncbi:hypothetical protein PUW21_12490 [Bacillus subtilis]|uniref:hypothetical protein n=1 Tax=Bacillus subtilis TaxID=1423 RepID=UPI002368DBC7|nr:hypothetical protein [Bacillus subtilis]WDI23825.1 hypothetical protein PUW21_12490 [Bacillus subtilis]